MILKKITIGKIIQRELPSHWEDIEYLVIGVQPSLYGVFKTRKEEEEFVCDV